MNDTICVVATSVGTSAINIIKVSGNKSINIVNKIFTKDLNKLESHTINLGYIIDNNEKIDNVLVSLFKSPKSYTGEDVVEINCHGGIGVTNKIMSLLLSNGCRLAEPGEFIKRSYLNGKIDLLEAESVSDLINAQTEGARKMSMQGLTGTLSNMIKDLRSKLLEIIANIEVNIDYPEYEDIIIYTNELLNKRMLEISKELNKILNESEKGLLIKNGINVGIVGKPNVGKSSLLNKLLSEEKAIVTDIEGTTRDIVEGKIVINGITINLTDTAGLRETSNLVEKIGVEKTKDIIFSSDLILALFDSSKELTKEDKEILSLIENKKSIIILNKIDLKQSIDKTIFNNKNIIEISTKDNINIDLIYKKIQDLFNLKELETSDYTYLSNTRQINIVKQCIKLTNEIIEQNNTNTPIDLIQIDIQSLWTLLGEIIGETIKDELLNEIFSKFCLGK